MPILRLAAPHVPQPQRSEVQEREGETDRNTERQRQGERTRWTLVTNYTGKDGWKRKIRNVLRGTENIPAHSLACSIICSLNARKESCLASKGHNLEAPLTLRNTQIFLTEETESIFTQNSSYQVWKKGTLKVSCNIEQHKIQYIHPFSTLLWTALGTRRNTQTFYKLKIQDSNEIIKFTKQI